MGFFESAEKRAERDAHRQDVLKQIDTCLTVAVQAAEKGDILAEATAIQQARVAAVAETTARWHPLDHATARCVSLEEEQKLRNVERFGFAGETVFFDDRIICAPVRTPGTRFQRPGPDGAKTQVRDLWDLSGPNARQNSATRLPMRLSPGPRWSET